MKRRPVASRQLRSVGYDAGSEALEVEFNHGAIYRHDEVPEEVFLGLMAAPSKGRCFNDAVRDGRFAYAFVARKRRR